MTTITAHTLPGEGQAHNEDWYAALPNLAVVLDGATIRTDTGCVHGLPWYVRRLGTSIVNFAQIPEWDLRTVLSAAIREVTALHSATCDLDHPGTPSAAVGIARITGEHLEWLVLGDITVMVDTTTGLFAVTDNRVSNTGYDLRRECDRYPIGSEEKNAAIQAMKDVELAMRNTDGGYWIASTETEAVDHAHVGAVPLDQVTRFALCSDGAMRATSITSIDSDEGVMAVLRALGPSGLVNMVRTAEHRDPLGTRVPRNKATDDATVVYVDMEVPVERPAVSEADRAAAIEELTSMTVGLFGACPTSDGRTL